MPSPFPGMDPYLEDPAHWRGVHAALIVACYETLNALLPDGFIARIAVLVGHLSRKQA